MNGYDCFVKLREIHEHLEVILMTGFGYDPAHCIVKARQQGLRSVLYKPFRLDQLLAEVEKAVSPADDPANSAIR
jgi:two-component system, sensor histidine kinase SagS